MTGRPRMSSKTRDQRQAGRRAERLEEIRDQVASGELVVRQATPEEIEKYGIKVDREKRGGSCR